MELPFLYGGAGVACTNGSRPVSPFRSCCRGCSRRSTNRLRSHLVRRDSPGWPPGIRTVQHEMRGKTAGVSGWGGGVWRGESYTNLGLLDECIRRTDEQRPSLPEPQRELLVEHCTRSHLGWGPILSLESYLCNVEIYPEDEPESSKRSDYIVCTRILELNYSAIQCSLSTCTSPAPRPPPHPLRDPPPRAPSRR